MVLKECVVPEKIVIEPRLEPEALKNCMPTQSPKKVTIRVEEIPGVFIKVNKN